MIETIKASIDLALLIDLVGFGFTLLYLIFIIRQNALGWYFSIVGSLIFAYSCYSGQLYIQSILYLFYVLIAEYGIVQWNKVSQVPKIRSMSFQFHVTFLSVSVVLGTTLGFIFAQYTNQELPYLDGIISIGAIGTTHLVVSKNRENWLYWMAINAASMYLYYSQSLWILVAMSFILFCVAIKGYLHWSKV